MYDIIVKTPSLPYPLVRKTIKGKKNALKAAKRYSKTQPSNKFTVKKKR